MCVCQPRRSVYPCPAPSLWWPSVGFLICDSVLCRFSQILFDEGRNLTFAAVPTLSSLSDVLWKCGNNSLFWVRGTQQHKAWCCFHNRAPTHSLASGPGTEPAAVSAHREQDRAGSTAALEGAFSYWPWCRVGLQRLLRTQRENVPNKSMVMH